MRLTLTYRGNVPARRRGSDVPLVKHALRRSFHPQLRDQLQGRLEPRSDQYALTHYRGHDFRSPVNARLATAVELDVLLLSRPRRKPLGDTDNRLKTLIDGLTRPQTPDQMRDYEGPDGGGPMYCLMDDDALVRSVRVDSRQWFAPDATEDQALVVVTATIVFGDAGDGSAPTDNMLLIF